MALWSSKIHFSVFFSLFTDVEKNQFYQPPTRGRGPPPGDQPVSEPPRGASEADLWDSGDYEKTSVDMSGEPSKRREETFGLFAGEGGGEDSR